MAFLCPATIRREWKKRVKCVPKPTTFEGRITGSSSVDTLVRIMREKNNGKKKPVLRVTHHFEACVAEELTVQPGDLVQLLYQDNEWLYCMRGKQEGFIPARICVPVDRLTPIPENKFDQSIYSIEEMMSKCQIEQLEINEDNSDSSFDTSSLKDCDGLSAKLKAKLKLTNSTDDEFSSGFHSGNNSPKTELGNRVPTKALAKNGSTSRCSVDSVHLRRPNSLKNKEQYLVLFAFKAESEIELSVYEGQCITVLNKDNDYWYWSCSKSGEGYVPSSHLVPAMEPQLESDGYCADQSALDDSFMECPEQTLRRVVPKRVIVLFDYNARSHDDLTVRQGEAVYCDVDNQQFDDWFWVYSPTSGKQGFIPKPFLKLHDTDPLITSV